MAEDDKMFRLRIPAEIKARIAAAAERSRRSMNAEIVVALERAFPETASGGEPA